MTDSIPLILFGSPGVTLEPGESITCEVAEAPPIPRPADPAPWWLYMVLCAACRQDEADDEKMILIFATQDERREWIATHTQVTGHTVFSAPSVRSDALTITRTPQEDQ